jgi:hypothetical protein
MSEYEWAKPEKPQPDSEFAGRNVWYVAFKSLEGAEFAVLTEWVVLSMGSFGSLYADEGGILSVQNDEDRGFWRAVYSALIKQNAMISYCMAVPGGFFRKYKYKHEYVGNDKTKLLENFTPDVHDPPADYIFVSDNPAAHEEEAIRRAKTFLEYVSQDDYPYSYMAPLLEDYQLILWTTRMELYLLTRHVYLSRDELKSRLTEAIQPFGLKLPKYDWIITHR